MRSNALLARVLQTTLLLAAVLAGGCHLEQGKLYFDEIGLDPITVYKMAPLEKTVFCLVEAKDKKVKNFDYLYNFALQDVARDPQAADWSELVCLSFSDDADPIQIRTTVELLDRVLEAQTKQSHPVAGFKNLLEQRLALYGEIKANRTQLARLEQEHKSQSASYNKERNSQKRLAAEQRKKIDRLEQQVRELKEIELLLHPKQ